MGLLGLVKKKKLAPSERLVYLVLRVSGGYLSVRDISRKSFLSERTVRWACSRLMRKGLIRRVIKKKDRWRYSTFGV